MRTEELGVRNDVRKALRRTRREVARFNKIQHGLIRLPPGAKLQTADEQGSLWLLECSLKYYIISYKIIHELVLYIKCKNKFQNATKMLLFKIHGLYHISIN